MDTKIDTVSKYSLSEVRVPLFLFKSHVSTDTKLTTDAIYFVSELAMSIISLSYSWIPILFKNAVS